MREIKFRGKRLDNGKWITGDLSRGKNGKVLVSTETKMFKTYACVDPETVGQFTGLFDKNGKEIYEGDILHAVGCNDATIGKHFYRSVSFVEGCFCLNVTAYNVAIPLRTHLVNHSLIWDVAGNIHDNPELLKGDEL